MALETFTPRQVQSEQVQIQGNDIKTFDSRIPLYHTYKKCVCVHVGCSIILLVFKYMCLYTIEIDSKSWVYVNTFMCE